MLKRTACFFIATLFISLGLEQNRPAPGILSGNVLDEKSKAVQDATITLSSLGDTLRSQFHAITSKDGSFLIQNIPFGYYRLKITFIGLRDLVIDSINF